MKFDKYIGLKYKEKGRDTDGIDCYGLVRLVYKNEYDIDLPSFSEEYTSDDDQRLQELISQYKEGWEEVQTPEEGCIVLFKVMGFESHMGVCVDSQNFLHVREGLDSVLEPFSTPRWKKRIVGYFKYSQKGNEDSKDTFATLQVIPHALKTERYTMPIPVGSTLESIVNSINQKFEVQEEFKPKLTVMLNGIPIPEDKWSTTVIKKDDSVSYRALAGKGVVRTIAVLALAVFAPYAATSLLGTTFGAYAATAIGQATFLGLTQAAVVIGGMALIDKIAPIRPPSAPSDPGSSERQLMVNGGANQINRYGAKTVVLGKVRLTPLLGAQNYLTFENERDSYLSMLLEWGFGPLEIDESSYKFGEVPVSNFTDYTIVTLDRKTEPTTEQLRAFNAIYGKDVDQKNLQQEIVCDGNPEVTVAPGPWIEATTTQSIDSVSLAIHFPQGLRKVKAQGSDAGQSFGTGVKIRVERSPDGINWSPLDFFDANPSVPRTVKRVEYVIIPPLFQEGRYEEITEVIQEHIAKKDAFTVTKTYDRIDADSHRFIRVRRETGDNTEDNPDWRYMHQTVLQSVTFRSNQAPAIDPPGCKISKTALKIKATDQLNGNLEGFNALVQTIAPVWNGSNWNTIAPTSNPASLMIYVLTHPANPRRKTINQINQVELGHFYTYCQTKGFEFNAVVAQQRSILEVIRDICASGRGSPNLKDGKWTVVIDEEKPVVGHFTPHNSWGFEGTKALPEFPHGLRVKYFDRDSNYQESEIIVYDNGYDELTASLFESIELPGVTKKSLVIDHAKWHMAQAKLRPEIYTLNSDIEYLTCNRGDRVKVMHDVPMWGLGSGRIKNVYADNVFELDEILPMEEGKSYTIRVRADDGSSHEANVIPYGLSYGTVSTSLFVDNNLELYEETGSDFLWLTSKNGSGVLPVVEKGVLLNPKGTEYNVDRIVLDRGVGSTSDDQSNIYCIIPKTDGSYAISFWAKSSTTSNQVIKVELNKTGIGPSALVTLTPQWQRFALYLGEEQKRTWKTLRLRVDGSTSSTADFHVWAPKFEEGLELPSNSLSNVIVLSDGWYDTVKTSVSLPKVKDGDLFMFGENQNEAQDCIVISIETSSNMSARLTLVDYGVTSEYNIFNDYLTLTEDTVFESQITLPPSIQINSFGTKTPRITNFQSDESVMEIISKGVFRYNISVSYSNADNLPSNVNEVQAEYDLSASPDTLNTRLVSTKYINGAINLPDVLEGEEYRVRLRYIADNGRVGLWTPYETHFVVGKTLQPSGVQGFVSNPEHSLGKVRLNWVSNTEPDIKSYEVRTNTDFGSQDGLVFLGEDLTCFADTPTSPGQTKTFYIAALDFAGLYSSVISTVDYTYPQLLEVQNVDFNFADTALTTATITLNWTVPDNHFDTDYYEVTYDSVVKQVKGNTITLSADWLGNRNFTIKTVDIVGNKSVGVQNYITKLPPNPPSNFRSQVIDNTVMLYWTNPDKTTLPIHTTRIKKGLTWELAQSIGEKTGEFTTIDELQSGNYTYWIATVDTDNNESVPISLTAQVAEPPDFEFFGEFTSDFTGTLVNAKRDDSSVVMPLNLTETWEQHFTTRTWDSPQDQINAGFPIYAQPTVSSGYYEEVFDYGTILASSKVTLNYNGTNFGGTPLVNSSLSVSADGVNYVTYTGTTSVFVTNFRFIKVKITVSNTDQKSLYKLEYLEVLLDAKKKSDSLTVQALSTDSLGTIVNFQKEFIDVDSITGTVQGSTPLIIVRDFQDSVLSCTYSVSSNVATISYPGHGFITGQNVRVGISTGLGVSNVYTITSSSTNSFTVNMTVGNTSGSCLVYPQSARIYVFNTSGVRQSALVSLAITGY
jgi:hypothetical protein